MKPLFDFNGDGKMDMLEFLIATADDPDNPLNEAHEEGDCDYADEDYDELECDED